MPCRTTLVAAAFALAACAETSEPDPTPMEDNGYGAVDPATMPASREATERTPGTWSNGAVDGRPAVLFAPPGSAPVFAIYCDGREGLVLERRGLMPVGEIGMMDLRVDHERHSYAVDEDQSAPRLRAAIPANDDMLTALRHVEEGIEVSVAAGEPLALPPSPLVAELVNSCELGGSGAAPSG